MTLCCEHSLESDLNGDAEPRPTGSLVQMTLRVSCTFSDPGCRVNVGL